MEANNRTTGSTLRSTQVAHWDSFFNWVLVNEKKGIRVCFKTAQHLGFPGQPLQKVEQGKNGELIAWVTMIGLTGPSGVLPQHYTKTIMERVKSGDTAMADFYDVFNNHIVNLFYQSWKKYRLGVLARNSKPHQEPFSKTVFGISGLEINKNINITHYFSGFFANKKRTVGNLKNMMTLILGPNVDITSFVGQWVDLPNSARGRLNSTTPQGQLGQGLSIGRRHWDVNHKITINVRQMTYESLSDALPGGRYFKYTQDLINAYVPTHISVDMHCYVNDCKHKPRLGFGAQLSRNTWLQTNNNTAVDTAFKVK